VNTNINDDFANHEYEIKPGEYVELIISDTGTGMEKEALDHIFEPFYTTKPDGKGTGLGMAMVYGFAKRYGGYINIYSEVGVGTTVRLYLPRSKTTSVKDEEQLLNMDMPTGNESVLIVDDEIDLLVLAEKFFAELGYKTQIAENGFQALDKLKDDAGIKLLFSDVVMPGGMNGYQLAEKAIKMYPELKILLTSGFTSRTIVENGLEKFNANLLSKPYRKMELAQRVRFILDET
jgi:CheY-like chemotaxis protein